MELLDPRSKRSLAVPLRQAKGRECAEHLCLLFLKLHRTKSLLASCVLPSKPDYELAADISSGLEGGVSQEELHERLSLCRSSAELGLIMS